MKGSQPARQYLALNALQPSQLYISAAKLAAVQTAWKPPQLDALAPIPIKTLHGYTIYTDGHTRAFAAYRLGFTEVPIIWDDDPLDWEAYQVCVDWCLEAGITTIADLETRVVAQAAYERLWYARCQILHARLAAQRRAAEP